MSGRKMLIKEYRICMPMPVEEYRIGQLYMIMKKSREESEGVDSGIEIIKNEPYINGPGGNGGQYTFKIYHIGKHLPHWLRSLFPKSALSVYEEAWNAYPYTLTRFRTPFMEKFQLDIESRYYDDCGDTENAFSLSPEELKQREVVYIDIVRDHTSDYHASEDPRLYKSSKTARGPLGDNWREEHTQEQASDAAKSVDGIAAPSFNRKRIMCAYKLCRIEFKYWGMQTRVENFISDFALRKTLIRAHRQAWCWQDEYIDLSIEDIRKLEGEVQKLLAAKMKPISEEKDDTQEINSTTTSSEAAAAFETVVVDGVTAADAEVQAAAVISQDSVSAAAAYVTITSALATSSRENLAAIGRDWSLEDEFFDAEEDLSPLPVWKETNNNEDNSNSPYSQQPAGSDNDAPILFIVLLSESPVDDLTASLSNSAVSSTFATFSSTLSSMACRFGVEKMLKKRSVFKLFTCPNVVAEIDKALSALSPLKYASFSDSGNNAISTPYSSLLTASSLLLVSSEMAAKALDDAVASLTAFTTHAVTECKVEFASHHSPIDVCFVADAHSSLVLFEALMRWPESTISDNFFSTGPRRRSSSNPSNVGAPRRSFNRTSFHYTNRFVTAPEEQSSLEQGAKHELASLPVGAKLDNVAEIPPNFVAKRCFFVGSPLGLVLAHRMHCFAPEMNHPNCMQMYNVFYEIDPLASRIEPLVLKQLGSIPPVFLPRFHSWSWCHRSYYLKDVLKSDSLGGDVDYEAASLWGSKRVDYALHCAHSDSRGGVFRTIPQSSFLQLLQSSYWENKDLATLILQEVFGENSHNDVRNSLGSELLPDRLVNSKDGVAGTPRRLMFEKWLKPHRLFKLRRPVPNHHASDLVSLHDAEKITIRGRMAYGAMDIIDLNGERVDCHIESVSDVTANRTWHFMGTSLTEENGRVSFSFALKDSTAAFAPGFHRALLVVRGDHSTAALTLAILPPNSRVALFSIDGSFSASLSLSGANPRLHNGCVEVVRHWAQAGYIIFYVSSRPDSQQNHVASWLAKHNFPLGLMAFPSSGLSAEPFRMKTAFIRQLLVEAKLDIAAAYGSAKDISIYTQAGIEPQRLFIVGREKRGHSQSSTAGVNWIADGYLEHLRWLVSSGFALFAPVQQWSLLRQWWSCMTPLTVNSPSPVDGIDSVFGTVPALPYSRATSNTAASQHRLACVSKDMVDGHTYVRNVASSESSSNS